MGQPLPVISVPPPSPYRAGEGGSCGAAVWGSEYRDVESWGARGDICRPVEGLEGPGDSEPLPLVLIVCLFLGGSQSRGCPAGLSPAPPCEQMA